MTLLEHPPPPIKYMGQIRWKSVKGMAWMTTIIGSSSEMRQDEARRQASEFNFAKRVAVLYLRDSPLN